MAGNLTRIKNNQVTDAATGNTQVGINAGTKVQNYSITATKIANNLTYGSDLTITGNLTVQGTTTAVNTVNTTIQDPLLVLADGQTSGSPSVDIGYVGLRGSQNSAAFVWKESQSEFVTALTTTDVGGTGLSNTTITVSSYANLHTGNATVQGTTSLVGNVVGTNTNFTGNITGGNLLTPGLVSATGNITGGNLNTGGAFSSSGNITGGNILTAGIMSSTGNATHGNISTAGLVSAAGNILTGSNVVATANVIGGNITTAGLISATGTITSAANVIGGNITTAGQVSATANVTGGNLLTGGLVSATSTITSGANITGANILTAGLVSATGNVTGGNVITGGLISATGNIDGQNLRASGTVSASGNVLASGNVSATGNVIGGNIVSTTFASTGNVTITAAAGTITLNPTGNVLMSSKNINNLADPVSPQDAATKNYVDTVAQGLDPKASVVYATTTSIFGSGYTYNNGTSGVGATLTAGAVGNLTIDGTVVSAGQRVLIKNEVGAYVNNTTQSAAFNGIYVVTTAGSPSVAYVLTRSTDFDQSTEMASAFTFVEDGATQADTGWTCITNNPITVGTTQILWAQFSGAGSYTANTSAGLSLIGTVFNALVDNTTTAFINGNIAVKTSAQLITPNIGAATGTSLSVTGTVTAASTVGGIITGTSVSTTGNITSAANVTGGNLLTAGIISTSGNIYGANLILTANETDTGNLTAGNLLTGGQVSATANITGGNLLTGGLISATGTITSAANVIGGNITTAGQVSATANITGGNILTNGIVSALGNITTANTLTATGTTATGVLAAIVGTANATGHATAVVTAAGNANSSAQFAFQNANAQSNASADIAVYNNLGTDTSYYIDMGITSSTFDGTAYGANIYSANDGYLYVVGNSATGPVGTSGNVGNLILGSTNGQVVVFVGNASTTNAITRTTSTGLSVTGAVTTTGNANIAGGTFFVNQATGSASFGNTTQTVNALVAFNTSTSILLPVGNTGQRPATGVTGMQRFNTQTNSLEVYNNTTWQAVGATVFTVIADDQFNGDGSTVAFTLSSSQTTNSCIVSINGIVQIPTTAYSVSGTTLTFTEAPAAGDLIDVREVTTTTSVISISNSQQTAIIQPVEAVATTNVTGNLNPIANGVSTLGNATNYWKSLYVGGNTIYLGSLQLKDNGSNSFAVYTSNGTTPANISVGNISVSSIVDGTSAFQFSGVNGNAIITAGGANTVTVTSIDASVTGNAYVSGALTVTGNLNVANINSQANLVVSDPLVYFQANSVGPYPYTYDIGFYSDFVGNPGNTYQHTGFVRDYADYTWKLVSNIPEPGGSTMSFTNAIYDALLTGSHSVVGNVTATTFVSAVGNVIGGNVNTAGQVSAGGNITGGNITTAGVITVNSGGAAAAIINGGANGSGNIGSSTGTFNTIFAKATTAQYADLAEKYTADAEYAPGTVLVFGGTAEVTVNAVDGDRRVAGVVSTDPGFLMNEGLDSEFAVAIALTGRVPCMVVGPVKKGDLMVAAGLGRARAEADPKVGSVIGKALEDFDGAEGTIEVVIGRF